MDRYDDFVTAVDVLNMAKHRAGTRWPVVTATEIAGWMSLSPRQKAKWFAYQLIYEGFVKNKPWYFEVVRYDDVADLGIANIPFLFGAPKSDLTVHEDIGYLKFQAEEFQSFSPSEWTLATESLEIARRFIVGMYQLKSERSQMQPPLLAVSDVLVNTDNWFGKDKPAKQSRKEMLRYRLLEGVVAGYWELEHVGAGGVEIKNIVTDQG